MNHELNNLEASEVLSVTLREAFGHHSDVPALAAANLRGFGDGGQPQAVADAVPAGAKEIILSKENTEC